MKNFISRILTLFLLSSLPCFAQATNNPPNQVASVVDKDASFFADQKVGVSWGKDLSWKDAPIHDFGPNKIDFETNGMKSLPLAPPYGVHPRIYLTPDSLPAVRKHLKEDETGKLSWKFIQAWTENLKGHYDPKADYNTPVLVNFAGLHTTVPLYRMGQVDPSVYQGLIKGDKTVKLPGQVWGGMSAEAFRCLIADDEKGAKDLAAATMTLIAIEQEKRAAENAKKHFTGPPDTPVGAAELAHIYDLIFKWLTPEQHRIMHDELANGSWHNPHYGNFETATWARSTWATFCHHILPLMAIEGEPGCNMIKLDACYRSWRNYINYSINRTGCIYEGEGKLVLGAGGIMALSQRPRYECLGAHPHLRRWADTFLPHSANASGDGFLGFDLLANAHGRPTSVDIMLMRYLYPDDKRIEWAYREILGPNYENLPNNVQQWAQMNNLLFGAIFGTDYSKGPIDPSTLGLGNTFFDGERALVMSRSDWSTNALQFTMQTRAVSGGHPYPDRNSIQVMGAGRTWSSVNGEEMFDNKAQSTVIIDGMPQAIDVPGRFVDFKDETNATFVVGDAKYNWDWNWENVDYNHSGRIYTVQEGKDGIIEKSVRPFAEIEPHCAADFHLNHQDDPAERIPLARRPFWMTGGGLMDPVARVPNYPVQRAFRTAGLVRGNHPYLLILDDIQKDNAIHHYDWQLQLETDVKIDKITPLSASNGVCDIILTTDGTSKRPVPADSELLIRVLQRNQDPSKPLTNGIAYFEDQKLGKHNKLVHRLIIPSDSVAPDYKVLIFPHQKGTPLPQTTWSADGKSLSVNWPDQQDTLNFSKQSIGKTDLSIERSLPSPANLIVLNKTISPLPDAPEEARQQAEEKNKSMALAQLTKYQPQNDPNLVGYWKFDEIRDGAFVDETAANLKIPAEGLGLVKSLFGKAVEFNGESVSANLPDLALPKSSPFSVMFWMKAPGNTGEIFSSSLNHGAGFSALWGNVSCTAPGADWKSPLLPTSRLGDWHPFAFTWDGKIGTYYFDGKPVYQAACQPEFGKATLGGKSDKACFKGAIDELMIFKKALSPEEVTKVNSWEKYLLAKP